MFGENVDYYAGIVDINKVYVCVCATKDELRWHGSSTIFFVEKSRYHLINDRIMRYNSVLD